MIGVIIIILVSVVIVYFIQRLEKEIEEEVNNINTRDVELGKYIDSESVKKMKRQMYQDFNKFDNF